MAYLPQSEVDKENQQQPGQGATNENVVQSGESGAIGSGGSAPAAAPVGGVQAQSAPAGQQGGGQAGGRRFTNLSAYLQGNQQQAAELGQKVAGAVGSKAQEAQQKTQQAQQSFNEALGKSGQGYDSGLVSSIKQGNIDTGSAQKALQAQYQGPKALSDVQGYNEAAGAQEAAKTALGQTQTEGGQAELLRQQFARPNYSAGAQRLDRFLLGGSQQGKQALEQVREQNKGLEAGFQQAGQQAQQAASQRQQETEKMRADVLGALQEQNTGLKSGLQSRAAQTNQQRQADQQALEQFMSNQKDMEGQGSRGEQLYRELQAQAGIGGGLNRSFVTKGRDVGISDVATEQERQKFGQLRQLLGGDLDYSLTDAGAGGAGSALGIDQGAVKASGLESKRVAENARNAAAERNALAGREEKGRAQAEAKSLAEKKAANAAAAEQKRVEAIMEEQRLKRGQGTYGGDAALKNFYKNNPELAKSNAANQKTAEKYGSDKALGNRYKAPK